MNDRIERECWIEHDGLRLEGLLRAGSAPLGAVILHPHPQYGGDMHNHVVSGMADALAGIGATTLRFNFRGVGHSTGTHNGGVGEVTDAAAAIDFLRDHAPDASILLIGYSFGALVGASASGARPLAGLLLVSPPLGFSTLPPLPKGVPALVAGGDRDPLAPAPSIRALEEYGAQISIVEGADHGWWPGLDSLAEQTAKFGQQLLSARSDT